MAQYKVPQDVEADDKLLGPLNFRQFIYLLIAAALLALAWALASLSEILIIVSILLVLPALFLLVLALPLRKDQPMETYIAALYQYYLKPNLRFWNPGQRESTIQIIAPKVVEKPLTRDLSDEEASRRLSFLANVVDSQGSSIRGETTPSNSPVREEFLAEANAITDVYDYTRPPVIAQNLASANQSQHNEVVAQMRAAMQASNPSAVEIPLSAPILNFSSSSYPPAAPAENSSFAPAPEPPAPSPVLTDLSKNTDFTVATIAHEAHRARKKHEPKKLEKEVYISLH